MSPDHRDDTLNAPDGSGLTWIFDHCLRYADQYEISLRAAYELNSQPVKSAMGTPSGARSSSITSSRNSVWSKNSRNSKSSCSSDMPEYDTNADFRACLTRTVSELPSQPCSLPPSFLISFVRRCFCLELSDVDFAQALTALDYIKGLQSRWKKEIDAAFRRLNVTSKDMSDPQHSELAHKYPHVLEWYKDISGKARLIDFMYTQVYVGLRRWVLVNEMMLEPFDKANCLALLNTLLPPPHRYSAPPTQQLSTVTLQHYRDAFFKYITTFEANPSILEPIIMQGSRPGDENGWPALYDTLDRYLTAVLEVIDECTLINEPCQVGKSGGQRRADSGISFGPRPASSRSVEADKPLPQFPELSNGTSKHGSFLDRFAMAWKKKDPKKEQEKELARSLKKMQSCRDFSSTKSSGRFNKKFSFDLTEEKRLRMINEAQSRRAAMQTETEASQPVGQAI